MLITAALGPAVCDTNFGGFAAATWIPLVSGMVAIFPALGLAELASAYPSSGGPISVREHQLHLSVFFVLTVHSHAFMVAPSRYKKGAGFLVAWLAILEWLFVVCSTTIFPAQLTAEMASIWYPEYTVQRWHIYLVYVAFLIGGELLS